MCQAENGYSIDYKFRIDKKGRYHNYENGRYKCIFYDKEDQSSLYLKYSDYGNKYLVYHEDNFDYFDGECHVSTSIDYQYCKEREEGRVSEPKADNCDNLFYDYSSVNSNQFSNPYKYIYDQWLATLIFSCFIFIFI